MTHRPLASWTDPVEIRDRIVVLYAKADSAARYNQSVAAGAPNPMLLDAKQYATLEELGRLGKTYPYLRHIGRALDYLHGRLRTLDGASGRLAA